MTMSPEPVLFDCAGSRLLGVVHRPQQPTGRGILIVVGGPQYRVGSHRQFVLLARQLAAAGYAVLRFDHRGIGDSDGPFLGFEQLEDDIDAALTALHRACPGLDDVVIWGLCDAASAALFYSRNKARMQRHAVTGLVLLNPWIRTDQGEAKAYLNQYYGRRILQTSFWAKLLSGKVDVIGSLRSFVNNLLKAFDDPGKAVAVSAPLPQLMLQAFSDFSGPVLFIISGNDLTAAEFEAEAAGDAWRAGLERSTVQRQYLPDSDHTFSRREWRDRVADLTIQWLRSW